MDDEVIVTTRYSRKEMSRRGKIGAAKLHERHPDGEEVTRPARATFMSRFDQADDPDVAKTDYFRALALRSAAIRKAKAATSALPNPNPS